MVDETRAYLIIQDFYILAEENPNASFEDLQMMYLDTGRSIRGYERFAYQGYYKCRSRDNTERD